MFFTRFPCHFGQRRAERGDVVDQHITATALDRPIEQGAADYRELRDEALRLEAEFSQLRGTAAEISREAFKREQQAVTGRLAKLGIAPLLAGSAG